jgi:hypothetical protein
MGFFGTLFDGPREVRYIDEIELLDLLENRVLELVVDTNNKKIYHVHPSVGHLQTVADILKIPKKDVSTSNAGYFVSAFIELMDRKVTKVQVGTSSLELSHKVEHTSIQIAIAQKLISDLIDLSLKLHSIKKAA